MNSKTTTPAIPAAMEPSNIDLEPIKSHDGPEASSEALPRRPSESDTLVPLRNLKVVDVAALIFNKMVGPSICMCRSDSTKAFKGRNRHIHDSGSGAHSDKVKTLGDRLLVPWWHIFPNMVKLNSRKSLLQALTDYLGDP